MEISLALTESLILTGLVLSLVFYKKNKIGLFLPVYLAISFMVIYKLDRIIRIENRPYCKYFDSHDFDKLHEKEPFRVGMLSSFTMIPQSYGLETVDTRGALHPRYYKEFFKEIIREQLDTKEKERMFDEYDYQVFLKDWRYEFKGLNTALLRMINTKYLIADFSFEGDYKRIIPFKNKRKLLREFNIGNYFVYELDCFKRGYLVNKAVRQADVLKALREATIEDLKRVAYFSELEFSSNGEGTVETVYYSPDKIVFEADISEPMLLVISNNYHPNWQAKVNGEVTTIHRANHAFQAVLLKDKHSVVELEYKDALLWKSHFLIPVGFLIVILVLRTPSTPPRCEHRRGVGGV